MNTYELRNGDCIKQMRSMLDNSIDSIVTDPPYELGFMGKKWDNTGIAFNIDVWVEALRVLKPGGHLIAFSGSRTYHRMAVAIEDAGFDIRDQIMWIYGSGFPKSLNVAKSIEGKLTLGSASWNDWHKLNGKLTEAKAQGSNGLVKLNAQQGNRPEQYASNGYLELEATTHEAKQWDGWGTALKPAHEPMVLARKPLIGTVADNVLTHGTGALNIDGSRIETDNENFDNLKGRPIQKLATRRDGETDEQYNNRVLESPAQQEALNKLKNLGRWPANVIFDELAGQILNEQSGISKSPKTYKRNIGTLGGERVAYTNIGEPAGTESLNYGDSGGASRFFYCPKASKRDRNEGLDEFEGQSISAKGNGLAGVCATCGANTLQGCNCPDRTYVNPMAKNHHPTVKPTELMRYLIKLITPPNGTVLDPFTGSGSTGKAAMLDGFSFIGIDLDPDYLAIAKARIEHAQSTMDK